ncbi:MAG: DUF4845 domain-containing protein [Gammaproteobacteria bacterium]|nr:DUF4845 domain-containing protein [Gammaproteobacteria bacterium]
MTLILKDKQQMRRRQAGMTTLGLVILVAFLALIAFAGLRLTPVYLNYMKVAGVVNGVYEEFDGTGASRSSIRSSLARRFDIDSVGVIEAKDVAVTKVDGGHEVAAVYAHKTPFIANVSFVVDFEKRVLIRR